MRRANVLVAQYRVSGVGGNLDLRLSPVRKWVRITELCKKLDLKRDEASYLIELGTGRTESQEPGDDTSLLPEQDILHDKQGEAPIT